MSSIRPSKNNFERLARELKAQKLARTLRAMPEQLTPAELLAAPDGLWSLLAQAAGVHTPSATTRALVAEIMGEVQAEARVA